MARGINKVILVGNLGDDPSTKYTQGGTAVCSMSLATTSVRKDRDGNTKEETQWHRVKTFGKLAEICGEYLSKGSQVYFEGEIRYSKSTGRDGVERFWTEIVANEMLMLGGGRQSDSGQHQAPQRREPAKRREPPSQQEFADDFADDDIPF